jgi:effector-binding domain-containing protein
MKTKKWILILSVIVALEFIIMTGICICDMGIQYRSVEPDVTIREVGPQVVLYTVYRGPYENICKVIDKLHHFALAKGMLPCGPVSTGYLNNPLSVSSGHWLIEIRLPVDVESLKYTGRLGPMTDIKKIPAMKFAVAVKPQGLTNPGAVISGLFSWIYREGYVVAGRMWQSVPVNVNEMGNYIGMKTEFMVPIKSPAMRKESDFVFQCAEFIGISRI